MTDRDPITVTSLERKMLDAVHRSGVDVGDLTAQVAIDCRTKTAHIALHNIEGMRVGPRMVLLLDDNFEIIDAVEPTTDEGKKRWREILAMAPLQTTGL